MATTVKEFTGGKYTEIKVDALNQIKGDFCDKITELLNKCGINYTVNERFKGMYGIKDEIAVKQFQEQQGLPVTGIVDDTTLNALLTVSENMSDIIYNEGIEDLNVDSAENQDPHYDSFFTEKNTKTTRKNKQNIVIEIGNAAVVKTIHNVFIRSVSVEVDTSGNPISEVYEFVAQDVTESDETNDYAKYS
jgi:peptidoglycan hydrolase-like protein with peptidoglycan-binding domain